MKKIGREVLFIATSENNARNGEDSFIRLKDGRIMHAYTKFISNSWDDGATADIVANYSVDNGETWSEEKIIIEHTSSARNAMCANLVRLGNGDLGIMYLRKMDETQNVRIELIRSADEGVTWSDPVRIPFVEDSYYVIENDHLIKLSSGKLLLPMNHHPYVRTNEEGKKIFNGHGKMTFAASDDDGKTWYNLSDEYDLPYPEISGTGLQETVVYEKLDGTLRAFSRTDLLCQYESISNDSGKTWSMPKPNTFFTSPTSPLNIKRIGNGNLVAVFNPKPGMPAYDPDNTRNNNWGRTPFVIAVSSDDGKTFSKVYYIEDDLTNGYCYPSIFDGGDFLLIGYYHSNGTGIPLNSNKVVKINYDELD